MDMRIAWRSRRRLGREAEGVGVGSNKPFALLGHSLGAYLAFHYANYYSSSRSSGSRSSSSSSSSSSSNDKGVQDNDNDDDNLCHLFMVSPFGLGCHPARRRRPIRENAWLVQWHRDLRAGRRPRNDYDPKEGAGGEAGRGLALWNLAFGALACCAPCLLLCTAVGRLCGGGGRNSGRGGRGILEELGSPITQVVGQVPVSFLRRAALQILLSMRFTDNGQWRTLSASTTTRPLASRP